MNVSAHRGGLVGVQRTGLAKNPVRDADLPDVVQETGQPDPLEPIGVEAELLADQHTQLRDGLAVVARSLVLGVDRPGECCGKEPLVVAVRALLGRRGRLGCETVGIDDDPATGTLGFVEGEVDVAKEHLGALEASGLGDPGGERDAGAITQTLALKTLGEQEGAPRALIWEQHHELIATDPVGGVVGPHGRAQALAQGAEARVAGLVAERVVDLLQTVEVEHHDAEARARASTARELALEVLVEGTMVAEASEVVGESSLRELRFPSPVRLSVRAASESRMTSSRRRRSSRRR